MQEKHLPGNNESEEFSIKSELTYLKYYIWLWCKKSKLVPTAKSGNVIFLHFTEFTIIYTLQNLKLGISFTLTLVQNLSSQEHTVKKVKLSCLCSFPNDTL